MYIQVKGLKDLFTISSMKMDTIINIPSFLPCVYFSVFSGLSFLHWAIFPSHLISHLLYHILLWTVLLISSYFVFNVHSKLLAQPLISHRPRNWLQGKMPFLAILFSPLSSSHCATHEQLLPFQHEQKHQFLKEVFHDLSPIRSCPFVCVLITCYSVFLYTIHGL